MTKTSSNHGGSNTGLNTCGRTSRNRSRSPTPRSPAHNKNTCNSPADNNNNEGGDTTSTTAPADQQSLNDSGSEVSDEGYRSLGLVNSCAVDGSVIQEGHEEMNKTDEGVVESEDAHLSGMYAAGLRGSGACLCIQHMRNYFAANQQNCVDLNYTIGVIFKYSRLTSGYLL